MLDPATGNVRRLGRRRRTHRHRRNRLIRRWCAVLVLTFFVAAASTFSLHYFSPSLFHSTSAFDRSDLTQTHENTLNQVLSQTPLPRPVYPYSIVPGGVQDAKELKWVAEHDPIVAAHYAGFDYAHAQVVRLTLAHTVYVSYRIGNNVYWSRRRIALKKGETLITDGKITARTRCGNQVKDTPQQEATSRMEPPAHMFDEPIRAGEGSSMQSPSVPFSSALETPHQIAGNEPLSPLGLYDPFVGGDYVPLSPPPLPEGLCGPAKKGQPAPTGGKKKLGPCGTSTGPATVPEPGTWLLFGTGLLFIYWQTRRNFART